MLKIILSSLILLVSLSLIGYSVCRLMFNLMINSIEEVEIKDKNNFKL